MCSPAKESWGDGDINVNCNARLVSTGVMNAPPIVVVVYQLAIISLFFAFPARILHENFASEVGVVLGSIFSFFSLVFFFLAALSDPGIVPRSENPLYMFQEIRPPRVQRVLTSRGRVSLNYCEECHIFRGKTTEHCPQSNNCISRFDHFCPWIGNDVGARNYAYFFLFVTNLCLLLALAVACSIAQLVLQRGLFHADRVSADIVGSLCLLVLSCVATLFSFPLCLMHVKLAGEGRTTQESLIPLVRRTAANNQGVFGWRPLTLFQTLARTRSQSLVWRKLQAETMATSDVVTEPVNREVSAGDFMARKRIGIVVSI